MARLRWMPRAELVAVEFDGDVLRCELLHVEGQLVLVALLDLQKDGGFRGLCGGGHIVLCVFHLVVHLLWGWRGHGRGGHSVLGLLASRGCCGWHGGHFFKGQPWHFHSSHGRHGHAYHHVRRHHG